MPNNFPRLIKLCGFWGIMWSCIFGSTYGINNVTHNICNDFGTCSQLCSSSTEGFTCSCVEGFNLSQNGWGCKPEDENWKLIYTTKTGIASISNGTITNFTLHKKRAFMTAVDVRENIVYWTVSTYESPAIYRTNLAQESEVQLIADTGLYSPQGIAFDWTTGNIYFADSWAGRIVVCSNYNNICAVLLRRTVVRPRGIALYPKDGIMFWTDDGDTPAILRAGMDGSLQLQIISTDLIYPKGITVDQTNARLYWVDAYGDKIESSRFDGTDRKIIMSELTHPITADIFGDRIYWIHSDPFYGIKSANKFNGSDVNTHVSDPNSWKGLTVIHIANQPITGPSACKEANCSHICTISPTRQFKCLCPVGMNLGADETTCLDSDYTAKLVVAFQDTINIMIIDAIGRDLFESTSLAPVIKSIAAIVYNPVNHTLILSDAGSKKIYSYDIDNKQLSVLIDKQLGMVQTLDIDIAGQNLYWVGSGRDTIEAFSLQTGARVLIQRDLQNISDILIVPEKSELYVTTVDAEGGKIFKMSLTGINPTIFKNMTENGPTSLTYDREEDCIIWADKRNGSVKSVPSNGSLSIVIAFNLSSPTSDILKFGNDLYYTNIYSNKLNMIDVTDSSFTLRWIQMRFVDANSSTILNDTNVWIKMTMINRRLYRVRNILTRHECAVNNPRKIRCSHACLPSGEQFLGVCVCPEGMILGEDSRTCSNSSCPGNTIACKNKTCIPSNYICDGKADCGDQEDEQNCTNRLCLPDYFQCPYDGICIPNNWVCDKYPDCVGEDDEVNCTKSCSDEMHCNFDTCWKTQFQCNDGQCIETRLVCDGVFHCTEGEDEDNCTVTNRETTIVFPSLRSQESTIASSPPPATTETTAEIKILTGNYLETESYWIMAVLLLGVIAVFLAVIIGLQCTQIIFKSRRAREQRCSKPRYTVNQVSRDDSNIDSAFETGGSTFGCNTVTITGISSRL